MVRMIEVGNTKLPHYLLPCGIPDSGEMPGWEELMTGGKRELVAVEHYRCRVLPGDSRTLAHDFSGIFRAGCVRCNAPKEGAGQLCRVGQDRETGTLVEPHRVHVVVLVGSLDDGGFFHSFFMDTSACSPLDNYDRREVFKLAFRRAHHLMRHGYPLGDGFNMDHTLVGDTAKTKFGSTIDRLVQPWQTHWRWWIKAEVQDSTLESKDRRQVRDRVRELVVNLTDLPLELGIGVMP